jgi:hypothetical protein
MPSFLRTQDEEAADEYLADYGAEDTISMLVDVQHWAFEDVTSSEIAILKTAVETVMRHSADSLRTALDAQKGHGHGMVVRDTIAQYIHRLHALLDLQTLAKEAKDAPRTIAMLSTNNLLKRHEDAVIKRIDADANVSNEATTALINNIFERRELWERAPAAPYFRTRMLYLRDAEKYLDVPSEEWTTIDKAVIEPRVGTPWIYRRLGDHQLAAYTPNFGVQTTDVAIGYWQPAATRTDERTMFPHEAREGVHEGLVTKLTPENLERARGNFEMEQYFRGRREKFPQRWNPEWYALCFADGN